MQRCSFLLLGGYCCWRRCSGLELARMACRSSRNSRATGVRLTACRQNPSGSCASFRPCVRMIAWDGVRTVANFKNQINGQALPIKVGKDVLFSPLAQLSRSQGVGRGYEDLSAAKYCSSVGTSMTLAAADGSEGIAVYWYLSPRMLLD